MTSFIYLTNVPFFRENTGFSSGWVHKSDSFKACQEYARNAIKPWSQGLLYSNITVFAQVCAPDSVYLLKHVLYVHTVEK